MHVYRWDLDRTYLDTAIHSMRGLLRSAFEDAAKKRALPGATTLLRGLVEGNDNEVCILSGSPEQMRRVLEEKLTLDGIRFSKLILKDNLGNLRRGRLRALRGQVGYKLPVLLQERQQTQPDVIETLFGDDSEADALIYVTYAEVIAGRVDPDLLVEVLERSGAYPDHIVMALSACSDLQPRDAVDGVFIRLDRRTPPARFDSLGPKVVAIHHWIQAALVLWDRGQLPATTVISLIHEVTKADGVWALEGLIQDAVRRGLVHRDRVAEVMDTDAGIDGGKQVRDVLTRMPTTPPKDPHPASPNLHVFMDALHKA